MDEPSDGITEAAEEQVRSLMTAAARAGEHIARRREAAKRLAAEQDTESARELQSRLEAEQQVGAAQLDNAQGDQWWDNAGPDQIAEAYQQARGLEADDPQAAAVANRAREEVRERYGLDLSGFSDGENPDPFQELKAQQRQEAQNEQRRAEGHREEAESVMDASEGIEHRADGSTFYDSGWRRQEFAEDLDQRGIDQQAIDARMQGDVSQGRPAADSVASGRGAAQARKGRGGPKRGHEATLGR